MSDKILVVDDEPDIRDFEIITEADIAHNCAASLRRLYYRMG